VAKGYGRSLDVTTLLVLVRHKFKEEGESAFSLRFSDEGWTSWWGSGLQDEDEAKFFETLDSAILALLIGNAEVAGTNDF